MQGNIDFDGFGGATQSALVFTDEAEEIKRAAIDELHWLTAIYTASPVVDQLLDRLGWPHEDRRLLDPSCGDGMFLARALDRLLAARPAGFEPGALIEGWEIHPGACHDARARVAQVFTRYGHSASRAAELAQNMVYNRDFLTDGPTRPYADFISGNPPYLRAANVPRYLREQYADYVPEWASADLLHSFLERCGRAVHPDGRIAFVTADRWLLNSGAARLRKSLGERFCIAHLERLEGDHVFYRPKHRKAGSPPRIHPVSVVLQGGSARGLQLSEQPIYPGVDVTRYAGYKTLGEFATVRIAPWLGTTGVFVVDASTAGRLPAEYLVPAVDTDDIVDGKLGEPTRWVIRTTPRTRPCDEIMEHLASQMHRMAARGRNAKLWVPPESTAMDISRESLLVPRIATSPKSVRVPPGVLPINHNLSIVAGTEEQLAVVEEALASPLAAQWAADHCPRLENGYMSLTTQLLRRMPMSNVPV
ncbi:MULTISPECIES: Eco57I restriction-modification methylase domain-containing protein [Paraburkholderia]|uniref:site-specific DNA-methyltransferase (adenine-specific) n=1 Tax=Paraburkholderia madseniana TaxID=2599607 RepID=A0AAP5ERJ8_9BURK|nr:MULTISPECIES: N-6 DNA methylase [Paraburkholderia]MCX4150013.1 N-6 DNA methylase [Paraburkholderia madseniana]MCX4177835.1 N-6 DNA methylase [Paraburkholderia madseniana]MDN7152949.1 SAM-dependent methyltransferase [Paraburkholderia sp. WS6]MDQ6411831.1 SAM-dependent methyltransferase [Paraburkholderia madseniana]MDQ6465822.1 SAM-dependent methyltransferase [Paraburkholderia madseniana]